MLFSRAENASEWFAGPWSLLAMLILIPVSLVIAHEIRKRFGDYTLLLLVFLCWLCWLAYLAFSRPGG